MFFYSIVILAAFLDQTFKLLAHKYLILGRTIPIVGHFINLTYVRNTGAAFSLFVGFSPYLAVIGLIVAAGVVYFHYRVPAKSFARQTALAFILGGSAGNLIDRILRGYVIDYIDVTVWPVFNLADIMINLGVIILLYKVLTGKGKNASDII